MFRSTIRGSDEHGSRQKSTTRVRRWWPTVHRSASVCPLTQPKADRWSSSIRRCAPPRQFWFGERCGSSVHPRRGGLRGIHTRWLGHQRQRGGHGDLAENFKHIVGHAVYRKAACPRRTGRFTSSTRPSRNSRPRRPWTCSTWTGSNGWTRTHGRTEASPTLSGLRSKIREGLVVLDPACTFRGEHPWFSSEVRPCSILKTVPCSKQRPVEWMSPDFMATSKRTAPAFHVHHGEGPQAEKTGRTPQPCLMTISRCPCPCPTQGVAGTASEAPFIPTHPPEQ